MKQGRNKVIRAGKTKAGMVCETCIVYYRLFHPYVLNAVVLTKLNE